MSDDPKQMAIHWMLRVAAGDMDETEWDAFTKWLEEAPQNAALLDEAQAADDWADGHASEFGTSIPQTDEGDHGKLPEAANDNPLRRILPFAGLVAAAIALFALWPSASDPVLLSTDPGETLQFAVSDDITVTLNGGSEVTVIEDETRVQIARGEVAFTIDSVEPSPLRVEVADLVLTDYGTIFNVVLSEASVSVAVAQGVVGINPDTINVEVQAGERVTKSLAGGALERGSVDPETVGAWSQGRLEFDNTPAPEAIAMLERSIGGRVKLAKALESETLTGTLIVSDDERETVTQFAQFLGAGARQGRLQGQGVIWDVR